MNKEGSNKEIIEYIKGELGPEDSQKLEEKMSISDFENDALEGLIQMKEKEMLEKIVLNLNIDLQKTLQKNIKRKNHFSQPVLFALISLITILLSIFMAFYIYHLLNG